MTGAEQTPNSPREILHGTWWLSHDPNRVVDGMVVLQPGELPRLQIHEQLLDPIGDRDEPFTVHGESGGRKVTLLGSVLDNHESEQVTRNKHTHTVFVHQTLKATVGAVIGHEHLDDDEQAKFADATVEIDYLTYLANPVMPEPVESTLQSDGTTTTTCSISLPADRTARFGDLDVTLKIYARPDPGEAHFAGEMRIPTSYQAVFQLRDSNTLMSIRTCVTAAGQLSDLITLAMGRPAHVRGIALGPELGSAARPDIRYRWWGAEPAPRREPIDWDDRRHINFTLSDTNFVSMLSSWHQLLTTACYGVGSIVALIRETSTYSETKLLGVCGAVEALARRIVIGPINYRPRARALADIVPPSVRDRVIPDVDRWVDCITKVRNDMAHGHDPDERKVPEELWSALEYATLALLILVLMNKVGVPEKAQRLAVEYGALRHYAEMGTRNL